MNIDDNPELRRSDQELAALITHIREGGPRASCWLMLTTSSALDREGTLSSGPSSSCRHAASKHARRRLTHER